MEILIANTERFKQQRVYIGSVLLIRKAHERYLSPKDKGCEG